MELQLSSFVEGGKHYRAGGIETIDIIKAKLTPEQYKGYLLGNIIKYSTRLNFKDSSLADANKCYDYAYWLTLLEQKNAANT